MDLSEWRITENRLDIQNKENTIRAFVSYKNTGITVRNTPTRNFFPDQGSKLLRFLFEQKPYGNPLWIGRIGVRYRFATCIDSNFNTLLERYLDRYLNLTNQAKDALSAGIIDIGCPINLRTNNGFLDTNSGPMQKDQLKLFFDFEKDLPELALYFDLDYWKEPKDLVEGKELVRIVKLFAEEIWDIHERVINLILG